MIRASNLHKSYRDGAATQQVLRALDLQVEAGEFVALVGASGSGKSTLLQLLGGLDRRYDGTLEVSGRELSRLSDRELARYRNRDVGFVFQAYNLLPPLDALQNVMLPSYFSDDGGGTESQAREALSRVGLAGKEHRLPAELSGGERQRVALARALYRKPRLLLADEPTGSLDVDTADGVIELLRELNGRDGMTLLVVTHEERVAQAAGRVLRMREGRLEERR